MKTQNHLSYQRMLIIGLAPIFIAAGLAVSSVRAQEADTAVNAQAAPAAENPTPAFSDAVIQDAGPGRISLDLKGIDIVELLKILSLKMGVNIVPTKEVAGRVNVFLNNVTLEDAFDIILINNSLAAVKEKHIVMVMTTERYTQLYGKSYNETRKVRMYRLKQASPKDVLNTLGQIKSDIGKLIIDESSGTLIIIEVPEVLALMEKTLYNLEKPKNTEVFELRYAKADEMKGQLADILTPGSSQVQLDTRTNKIVITDLPEKMKKIKKMIEEFDQPTRQVLIEAQIVQINLNKRTSLGINWERLFTNGKLRDINLKGTFPLSGVAEAGQFSLGTMASNDFTIVMDMLNSLTKTNILSRPRIAVLNNQEASILIGSKEAYFSQSQSQSSVTTTTAETINYVEVGVKLSVTPTITEDGFIMMKIRPEVSSVRETVTSPLGSTVPVVETAQAETSVKVKDNVMIMIAGLMKESSSDNRIQWPVLYKLPLVGWLFGNRDSSKVKSEIAIFLTPHIITGDVEQPDAEKELVKRTGILTKQPKGREE